MTTIIKYKKGLILTDDHIYIGRAFACFKESSKWANNFIIGRDGTREQVIEKYKNYVMNNAELMSALPELKNKILVCWCAPQRCHANALIELLAELS